MLQLHQAWDLCPEQTLNTSAIQKNGPCPFCRVTHMVIKCLHHTCLDPSHPNIQCSQLVMFTDNPCHPCQLQANPCKVKDGKDTLQQPLNSTFAYHAMTCIGTGTQRTTRVRVSKHMKAKSRKCSELQNSAWLS